MIKNGIGYQAITAALAKNKEPVGHKDMLSIEDAFQAIMADPKKVLLASSLEASYISVKVCLLLLILRYKFSIIRFTFHTYQRTVHSSPLGS